ncbi:hypothetical protein E2C01_035190 [Portunus trituberculatus]|uniref:Uncharacterized protein n=1 Tax=Portunus trituberculatus TaxID=210409 RepID=A0A5B7F2I5_PORTR|nr:hypothetical protein [Portunus trituberculatus]
MCQSSEREEPLQMYDSTFDSKFMKCAYIVERRRPHCLILLELKLEEHEQPEGNIYHDAEDGQAQAAVQHEEPERGVLGQGMLHAVLSGGRLQGPHPLDDRLEVRLRLRRPVRDGDMHQDVHEENGDDREEPQVDELHLGSLGQCVGEVCEEREKHQEGREGHDGAGVDRLLSDEERGPANHQHQQRRQEGGQHHSTGPPLQVHLEHDEMGGGVRTDLGVNDSVQCQVLHPRVLHGGAVQREQHAVAMGTGQAHVDVAALHVQRIEPEGEVADHVRRVLVHQQYGVSRTGIEHVCNTQGASLSGPDLLLSLRLPRNALTPNCWCCAVRSKR